MDSNELLDVEVSLVRKSGKTVALHDGQRLRLHVQTRADAIRSGRAVRADRAQRR